MQRDEELHAGDRVGDYAVVRPIGRGGFGRVYEVVHSTLGKRAAAKVLSSERASRPEVIRRFLQEARAGARVEHPGIVEVFAFGQLDDGRPYFVMELLSGKSLGTLLAERGRLELEEALPILEGVADALDAAHAHGIAHRDLKPENVFLEDREGGTTPRLLDFGVAKLVDAAGDLETDDGALIGTPHYMSPEQSRGRSADTRADLYALGVLCFRVLTGQHPFEADDAVGILVQHAAHSPPRPSSVRPTLSRAVDEAVLAMLAKDPAKRPRSAAVAVRALSAEPVARRKTWRWAALALLVGVTALAAVIARRSPVGPSSAAASPIAPAGPSLAESATTERAAPVVAAAPASAPTSSSKPSVQRAQRAPDPEAIEDPFRH